MLFPPTSPSLPDREGSVGDATVEASVLPGGGSRRPEGGRCERLWGSPLRGRDRRAARKAWCRRPLFREEPSVPFTRTLPPYSLSPPPGMEPCAAWSPRGGRGTATLPFRGVQQTRGGMGTEGRGKGSTRAGAAPGGDPLAEELGKSGHSRRRDTGRFSATLHPFLLRLSFLLPARAKSFFRPGGGWAGVGWGGRRRESSFRGQHPSTCRGQSVGALGVIDPGAVRNEGFVGARKARHPGADRARGRGRVVCAREREPGALRV